MSTRLSKVTVKTPRIIGKSEKFDKMKSKNECETFSYNYEAALSQPDLTTFFKKETFNNIKTDCHDGASNDKTIQSVEAGEKNLHLFVGAGINALTNVQTVCPTNNSKKQKCEKTVEVKAARTSRIPRAKFAGLSKLPLKTKMKKSSMTQICTSKSKSMTAEDSREVQRIIETRQSSDNMIEDCRLSDNKITFIDSASKSIFSEEKCSGIEADIEIDPDQEFTTSTDNSPGRIITKANPSISSILRTSKLSCACRSCNDPASELPRHRINSDIWTDSRSSPDVGRYASSGRNGRTKSRRLLGMSKSRGYLDETTEESDIEATTDISIYAPNRKKITKKRENLSDIPKPVGIVTKTSNVANPTARLKSRSHTTFSFFNTLFEIVFWPFIFLRNER